MWFPLDYETLLRILPASSPLLPSIQRAILSLKPRIAIQQKRETDEMMGKLKDLGNNVLGTSLNRFSVKINLDKYAAAISQDGSVFRQIISSLLQTGKAAIP
jgi:hypothetical protein